MLLPHQLLVELRGLEPHVVGTGCSGASVMRFDEHGAPRFFLKTSVETDSVELVREAERLVWLENRLPVPRVIACISDDVRKYLLTETLPGTDASHEEWLAQPATLLSKLADGLRLIHSISHHGCPFDRRLPQVLSEAAARIQAKLVDETDFDGARQGRSAESLWEELNRTIPPSEDLAFTHGDFCLPNIIVLPDGGLGFVDLGRSGVADRYQDVALAVRSAHENLGAHWAAQLLRDYGIPEPDERKIAFYQLLDEFF
ncbi:MAG TPA: APH(3') family aminoglycoside O-phosphotransferase [Bryobacteraceae bacterium]|nr:APH(3') family aminoglycoside O-phosphotransferase [Bryobacteraceae bacterium]